MKAGTLPGAGSAPTAYSVVKSAARVIAGEVKQEVFGISKDVSSSAQGATGTDSLQQTSLVISRDVAEQVTLALEDGESLTDAIADVDFPTHWYKEQYSMRDDNRKDFEAMLRLFLYLEVSSEGQRWVADQFKYDNRLAGRFGFHEEPPTQGTISYTKRERFHHAILSSLNTTGTKIAEAAHEHGVPLDELSIEREPDPEPEDFLEQDVARACTVVFERFNTNRPTHRRLFGDDSFLRQYAYSAMGSTGIPQGTRRYNRAEGDGMGKSNHYRIAKSFTEDEILKILDQAAVSCVDRLRFFPQFKDPVSIAIDITPIPYWGDLENFPKRLRYDYEDDNANDYQFRIGTVTVVGENIPLILAAEPYIEDSEWNGREYPAVDAMSKADLVSSLIDRLPDFLKYQFVLMDRGFSGGEVCHELEQRGMTYLTPRQKNNTQKETARRMNFDWGKDKHVENEGYPIGSSHYTDTKTAYIKRRAYDDEEDENGHENIHTFQTNADWISESNARSAVDNHYGKRWRIESQYNSMKNNLMPDVRTWKHYEPRLLAFVLGCMFHNGWRLTNFYQKRRRDGEHDYKDVPVAANEFVDLARKYLET